MSRRAEIGESLWTVLNGWKRAVKLALMHDIWLD